MALAPCPSCRRHVDVSSASCPFCGSACSDLQARGAPLGRLSRKALALASSMAIVGCSDSSVSIPAYGASFDATPETAVEGGTDTGTTDSGTAPTDSGSEDSGSDAADSGGALPPYGLPPSDGG